MIAVKTLENKAVGKLPIADQFKEEIRQDVILRAVLSLQSRRRQAYGATAMAGKRQVGKLSRRRRDYKGSYGHGISRVPRKTLNRRGSRMYWVGAVAPGTVGGRRAHPPKPSSLWEQKINKKENRLAIRSALSATMLPDVVRQRGHVIPSEYPFLVENSLESIETTSQLRKILETLGFKDELIRASEKKVRAGKGKLRGRVYRKKVGLLLVVSGHCSLEKAGRNLAGVSVARVHELNAETLAPGALPGRVTLLSQQAYEILQKEGLFL